MILFLIQFHPSFSVYYDAKLWSTPVILLQIYPQFIKNFVQFALWLELGVSEITLDENW